MHYLFHGKSSFLSLREAHKKINELKETYPEFEYVSIDLDSADLDIIIQNISTANMFNAGKILFIKRTLSNKNKKNISEAIIELISTPSESTHFVFWEDKKVPSNTRYFKAFNDTKVAFEAATLNKRTFITWTKNEIKDTNIKFDNTAINLLSEKCNFDPERFVNELDKIKLSGNKSVTVADIEDGSANTLETTIWYLLDVVNGSKDGKPIKIIDDLLSQRESPIFILSMIIRNTRLLILTKALLEKDKDSKSIAKTLKIPPFTVYPLISYAKKTTMEKLKSLYMKLYNLDFEIKTGNIDPELGLTLIATRL